MRSIGKKILSVILSLLFLTGIVGVGLSENGMLSITAEAASNPYSYNATYNGEWANCTWWAWQLAYDNTGVALPAWGDAKTWYSSAQAAGFQCDTTPAPNSIACYFSGNLGHVQFVSAVSGNQIYIKEGGYPGTSNGYHEGWRSTSGVDGYIHLVPSHTCDYMASAVITKAPTRTETGTRVRYCSCGKSISETISAIPYVTDIPEGIYTITSKCGSGLRVSTRSINGYYDVYICDGDYVDQYWLFIKNSDGTYTIENAYYNSRVLDVENIYMFNAGEICTSTYNGGDNQRFYIVPFGDGYYKFVAKHSYLCLDNVNASTTPGNGLIQCYDNGSDAQKWKIQLSNPALNASTTSVNMKFGESRTVNFSLGRETYNVYLEYANSNASICTASLGQWNGMQTSLTINGKQGGNSDLTIYLKDVETGIVLGTKTISVTVTGNYTLTYNANGGTNPPPSQKGEDNIKLSGAKPTRDGYTFLGWAKSKTATSAQYQPGATFSLTANTTLYAVWKQNPAPVIEIKNFKESRTEAYGASILFTAVTENAPSGSSVHWYYNGEDVGSSATFLMKRADSSYTVQAKLVDSGGNIIAESKQETVNIKTGFFAKLIAFFRSLFGLLPYIEQ